MKLYFGSTSLRSMITIRTWRLFPSFSRQFLVPMSKIFSIRMYRKTFVRPRVSKVFLFVDDKKSKNHRRRETCPLIYTILTTFQIWKTHDTDAHHIPERNQRSDTFLLRELLDVSRVRIYRRDCRGRYLQRWIYFR